MQRALCSFLIFFSLLSNTAKTLEAKGLDCAIRAKSAVVYNPDSCSLLYKKNFDEPHYPASIMKIATAAYILDKDLDLKTLCFVSQEATRVIQAQLKQVNPLAYPAYILEHDGVMLWLKKGASHSLEALLHGILLTSSNDAANVIAENVSGSIDQFMEELNHYLKSKGITQTRLQNPHGLHHPAQMTTAYDMARIAKLAFDHPEFLRIIKAPAFASEGLVLENKNPLLRKGKYHYDKIIGGKTGYTSDAGYNLVACAEHEGRRLIVVLMGCASTQERSEDAIALFETAFREQPVSRLLFSKEQGPFIHKETGWKADLREDIRVTYYPSEETPLTTEINWYKKVKKREAGQLIVKNEGGVTMAIAPLYITQKRGSPSSQWPFWGMIIGGGIGLFFAFKYLKKGRKSLKG